MDKNKIINEASKLLNQMAESTLTFEESIEVIKLLQKSLNDALYQQARISLSLVIQNCKI